jgi:hypothetical protein
MKQILILFLFTSVFTLSIPAQRKPITKSVKVQPQKIKEVTEQIATTLDGKSVVIKSDGTWQFSAVQETPQQPKVKPCELTLKDAPVIRGLKLGITQDSVERLFGIGSDNKTLFYYGSEKTFPNDLSHYTFYNSSLEKFTALSDIDSLELDFFRDELHSIKVRYSDKAGIFTKEQFKSKISEVFKLPVEGWANSQFYIETDVSFPIAEKLKCAEFEVEISLGNTLTLTNGFTSQKIKEIEEDKRKTFKP